MLYKKASFLVLAAMLLLASACKTDKPDVPETPVTPKSYKAPAFSADSAYAYIERQVAFGPRLPNTEGHKACRKWLVEQLKGYGLDVIEQNFQPVTYTGSTLNATNIIGRYNPDARKRIVLAAHWDTRHIADSPLSTERQSEPILGADDAGSGVGVLLELARQLKANPIEAQHLGIDIIFFDAEDYGQSGGSETTYCLGSQHWSKNPHVSNYKANYGILLDMVGAGGARFTKEQVSMRYAPDLMNKVWKMANSMGHGNHFVDVPTGPLVDDHYFVNTIAGIPMIDIINRPTGTDTGFGAHWHTHGDDMDIINKGTLKAVGQVVTAVVYREASGSF